MVSSNGSKSRRKKVIFVHLSPPLQQCVKEGIVATASRWSVDLSGRTTFYFNRSAIYTGSQDNTKKSLSSYVKPHYTGLWKFLARIGDFDSMLLLVSDPLLERCPAMKAESLILYLRWKRNSKEDFLTHKHLPDEKIPDLLYAPFPPNNPHYLKCTAK